MVISVSSHVDSFMLDRRDLWYSQEMNVAVSSGYVAYILSQLLFLSSDVSS